MKLSKTNPEPFFVATAAFANSPDARYLVQHDKKRVQHTCCSTACARIRPQPASAWRKQAWKISQWGCAIIRRIRHTSPGLENTHRKRRRVSPASSRRRAARLTTMSFFWLAGSSARDMMTVWLYSSIEALQQRDRRRTRRDENNDFR